jgi:DNA-binding CsgD family transcriptional regulator
MERTGRHLPARIFVVGGPGMPLPYLAASEWYYQLAKLASHIGTDNFHAQLAECLQTISGYDSTFIARFHPQLNPEKIYDNLDSEFRDATAGPYLRGAYLLDPFYALFRNGVRSGRFRLAEIAPDGFFRSAYFRKFYESTGLKGETGIFVPHTDDSVFLVSLGRRGISRSIRQRQHEYLATASPLLVELAVKHWQVSRGGQGRNKNTIARSLDSAFRNFGRNHLSARECETVQLVLKGYSSKAIAQLLEISPETVKVYRKRVHSKLGIRSQAELFSLFFEAVTLLRTETDMDPLTLYFAES